MILIRELSTTFSVEAICVFTLKCWRAGCLPVDNPAGKRWAEPRAPAAIAKVEFARSSSPCMLRSMEALCPDWKIDRVADIPAAVAHGAGKRDAAQKDEERWT